MKISLGGFKVTNGDIRRILLDDLKELSDTEKLNMLCVDVGALKVDVVWLKRIVMLVLLSMLGLGGKVILI